jgi:hypothetical protein
MPPDPSHEESAQARFWSKRQYTAILQASETECNSRLLKDAAFGYPLRFKTNPSGHRSGTDKGAWCGTLL